MVDEHGLWVKLRLAVGITRGARNPPTLQERGSPLQNTVSLRKPAMLTLNINGKDQELDVPADMPLLWVLRDVAHLTLSLIHI